MPPYAAPAGSSSRSAAVPDEGERWRLFIAVALPETVHHQLEAPLQDLQSLATWIRANPAERTHLTLHFLGNVDAGRNGELVATIEPVVAAHRRFALTVEGVGAFPDRKRPKVLWAGVTGRRVPDLIQLQQAIGSALLRIGFDVDARFTPHLTLGRVRSPLRAEGSEAFDAWYRRWQFAQFGEFTVDNVHLMRSQLGAGPARYTTLATFALQ
jgi:RNA 2',3'-cyclic 3'-phosphodiesterase